MRFPQNTGCFVAAVLILFVLLIGAIAGITTYGYGQLEISFEAQEYSPRIEVSDSSVADVIFDVFKGDLLGAAASMIKGMDIEGVITFNNHSFVPLYIPAVKHQVIIEGKEYGNVIETKSAWIAPKSHQSQSISLLILDLPEIAPGALTPGTTVKIEIVSAVPLGSFSITKITTDILEGTNSLSSIIEEVITEKAADIAEEMGANNAADIIAGIGTEKAADIIAKVTTGKAADITAEMGTEKAADIIAEVSIEKAVAIIAEMGSEKAADIIAAMGTKKAVDIIAAVTTTKAADIIEGVSIETAVAIIERTGTEKAVAIIAEVNTKKAADIIAEMGIEKAVDIIEEVNMEKTVDIIEEMGIEKAVDIITEVSTVKATGIITEVSTEKAIDIIEEVTTEKAVAIIEEVGTEKAVDIIAEVTTDKSADIIEQVSMEKAVDVMEKLTTAKLTDMIPAMSEASLTMRLPELSTEKLYSIEPQMLFKSLPNAPTEQLVSEEPPEPPAEATAPIVLYATPREARYLAVETWAGKWVVVMGTPTPVDKLMIKTRRALKDIETIIEVLEQQPRGVAATPPAEQVVMTYLDISFEKITSEDIALGHMTFKVEKEWLAQNSAHKWSVVLSRYDPELKQWISLPTKKVKEDDSYVYYTGVITHFSKYAILGSHLVPVSKFKVNNLVIDLTEVETGQETTIKTYVTNLSDTAGTYVAILWINNTVEAGQDIYLEAGETKPVSFAVTRDIAGSYDVRFDRLFGSFSVIKASKPLLPAPSPVTAPAPTPAVKPPINWLLVSGITIWVVIVGLLLFLLFTKRADLPYPD